MRDSIYLMGYASARATRKIYLCRYLIKMKKWHTSHIASDAHALIGRIIRRHWGER